MHLSFVLLFSRKAKFSQYAKDIFKYMVNAFTCLSSVHSNHINFNGEIYHNMPPISIRLTSIMYLQPQLDLFSYLHPHNCPPSFSYVNCVSCGIDKWTSLIVLKSSSVMTVIGGVSNRGASDSSRGKSTWNIILSTQLRSLGEFSAKENKCEKYIFTPIELRQLEIDWISIECAKTPASIRSVETNTYIFDSITRRRNDNNKIVLRTCERALNFHILIIY